MKRMLDLFCGHLGWSKAFLARGWQVTGIDLIDPPEIPDGFSFRCFDVLGITAESIHGYDFICASSPCEQFSLFGLPHFHPSPPYPELGIKLFNHTRAICEASGVPYIMENVRCAQNFVGRAVHHCGPFYLWGNAVPPLLPMGIKKGVAMGSGSKMRGMTAKEKHDYRKQFPAMQVGGKSKQRQEYTSKWATIPPELAKTVVDYAESCDPPATSNVLCQ